MLTRLKVSGFKNLVDVDVHFGPFTCIAGANGTGKSNLFDAIRFLSLTASMTLNEAAQQIRENHILREHANIRDLFTRTSKGHVDRMRFEAEFITSLTGLDAFGHEITATDTYLRYTLELGYSEHPEARSRASLVLLRERLESIGSGTPLFAQESSDPIQSVIVDSRTLFFDFDVTRETVETTLPVLGDLVSNIGGKNPFNIRSLQSVLNLTGQIPLKADYSSVILARDELMSWRVLQLNPDAMRGSGLYIDPPAIRNDGRFLAATLDYLARRNRSAGDEPDEEQILVELANRLRQLIGDVESISLDRNDFREELTVYLTDREGTTLPAKALSDGTLRFLALAVLEMERTPGVICIEEPENGIHPARIPALLRLLQDMAVSLDYPLDATNPLRQVIINTHSPAVVQQVPEASLLVARMINVPEDGTYRSRVRFEGLPGTWRVPDVTSPDAVSSIAMLNYLNPVPLSPDDHGPGTARRVIDREDMRALLDLIFGAEPA